MRTPSPSSIIHVNNEVISVNEEQPFDRKSLKYIPATTILQNYNSMMIENPESVNWERFAYVFYATEPDRLLPILINVSQLQKLKTQAQVEVICSFDIESSDLDTKKMVSVLKKDNVHFTLVEPITSGFRKDENYWKESFTKFHAFNLTNYDRVIFMDADSIILRTMDHLFFLPPALLATTVNYLEFKDTDLPLVRERYDERDLPPTPLEYVSNIHDLYKKLIEHEYKFDAEYFWKLYKELPSMEVSVDTLKNLRLGSYFMVIQPNKRAFEWLKDAVNNKKQEGYDMEIVNNVWKLTDIINKNEFMFDKQEGSNQWLKQEKIPALLVLPHNPYALVSGEFRHDIFRHSAYLSSPVDFPYLKKTTTSLSIRRISSGVDYDGIEDTMDKFLEVGYWDWAWRFGEEKGTTEKEESESDGSQIGWKSDRLKAIYQSEEISFNIDIFGWDSRRIYRDAYYIHWSDWPLNKPWKLSNIEDNSNPIFIKIGADSLASCLQAVGDVFDELGIKAENERQLAISECKQSNKCWNQIYSDYLKMMVDTQIRVDSE